MEWSVLQQYGPSLLKGFGNTILCWALGTVFGMALGLVIALIQRYAPRWVTWIVQAYIEVIRGTPFLVQLFVLYYGGPLVGLRLDALPAGLLGLTIYGSPYFAEIFRSGFRAVPDRPDRGGPCDRHVRIGYCATNPDCLWAWSLLCQRW